jgi:hypothetical protein
MNLHAVVSTNVLAVGYDPATQTLRVQFRSGGVYDYFGVAPDVFEQMLRPNPWRRIGRVVMAHRYCQAA